MHGRSNGALAARPRRSARTRLARDGESEPIHIEETDTTFAIGWKGNIRTRDDVEQLLFIGRKARPDLAQVVDRVDVGNDGAVARPFQPLVVETAARTLADDWRLWHRNCAE